MQFKFFLLLIFTVIVISILVGCSSGPAPTPIIIVVTATPQPSLTPDVIATDVARQRAVAATLTAEAPKPLPTIAPPPTAVPTIAPTETRIPPTAVAVPTPQNRFRNFQCGDDGFQGKQRLTCSVEYTYNGEWGANNIYVSATGWNDTPAQILEIYADRKPITPGEGSVMLTLELHDRGTYFTSQNQFCMFAEGSVPRVYCQFQRYSKTWSR